MWILTEIFYDCAQITKSCSRIVDSSTMRCRGLCFIASTDRPWPIEALSLTNFIPKWKTSHGSRQEWRCLAFHGWNIPYLGWRGFLIAGKQFLKSICLLNIQNSLQAIRAKSVNNLSRVEFAQMLKPTWNALETSSSARFECCLDFHPTTGLPSVLSFQTLPGCLPPDASAQAMTMLWFLRPYRMFVPQSVVCFWDLQGCGPAQRSLIGSRIWADKTGRYAKIFWQTFCYELIQVHTC